MCVAIRPRSLAVTKISKISESANIPYASISLKAQVMCKINSGDG